MKVKALWNGEVIAESNQTIVIEGNHYFPPGEVVWDYFQKSDTHTQCFWKGQASYYNLDVNGQVNRDAAWYYPQASNSAKRIENYVAFWHGVQVLADTK